MSKTISKHAPMAIGVLLQIGGTVVPPANFQAKTIKSRIHKALSAKITHAHGHAHVYARKPLKSVQKK